MANICLYKIKVKGRQRACYALVDMMPLYSWEKEYLSEEGTEDDFELIFLGACKWAVDSYTSKMNNPVPFTDEELNAVQDGDHWDKTLKDKSVLLDCEIFCNSKDIDDPSYAYYEHYDRGVAIYDECPKELHIKRGRDYDQAYTIDESGKLVVVEPTFTIGRACKVKFEVGTYTYAGDFNVGNIVKVEGAKAGCIGRVVEIDDNATLDGLYKITDCIGVADAFVEADIEVLYTSKKPAERKPYLVKLGLDEKTTKKKFLSVMDYRWTVFAIKDNDWKKFVGLVEIADEAVVKL